MWVLYEQFFPVTMWKATGTWGYSVFHGPMLFYLIITFDRLHHNSEMLDVILQLFVTAVCCCIEPHVIVLKAVFICVYLHGRGR